MNLHTLPLPWKVACRGRKVDIQSSTSEELAQVYLTSYYGKRVTQENRDNAKLILIACNTHTLLVDTLLRVQNALGQPDCNVAELQATIAQAVERVRQESLAAEKAIKPVGTPSNAFWPALGNTPGKL